MQFYALGTNPILNLLRSQVPEVQQVWLADDASGAGKLAQLRVWWDNIIREGAKFGYSVNQSKSWLILKNPDIELAAQSIFEGSSIQITTAGMRHLGAALGSQDFKKKYISDKVSKWIEGIEKLSEIAESQPHAAYSAYVHGYQHKFHYFLRTLDDIEEELRPLDEVITSKLNHRLPLLATNTPDIRR